MDYELIQPERTQQLCKQLCDLVGIKPVRCFIYNNSTGEIRYYTHRTGKYKIPKGWNNYITGTYDEPVYPDFTEPENFVKLLDIQWQIFGSLGPQYVKADNESFPLNYLYTKVKAINLCKSFGGADMLDKYIEQVRYTDFNYPLPEEIQC